MTWHSVIVFSGQSSLAKNPVSDYIKSVVSALIFSIVASAPIALDWNGLPLQRALENYGATAGIRLRCEPALAREPIFAWAPASTPKEVMDRLADVMVATWTRQPDGTLRLSREVGDQRRLQTLRLKETERLFAPQIKAIIDSSRLDEPVTVADATRALKAMIANRSKDYTEWERMKANRALDARLAGGRLIARILSAVGTAALAPLAEHPRTVLSSVPTRRQGLIPNASAILAAFAEEHEILIRAADQTGPPPLSATGVQAQGWFSEPLRNRPARLQLRIDRNPFEQSLVLSASVFEPDGSIAFSTGLTLSATAPRSVFPTNLKIPVDAPERDAQLDVVRNYRGGPTLQTRQATLALLEPDPLAAPFGERLRNIARANGRNLMARVGDQALRFVLTATPKVALAQMLETTSLSDEGGWLTVRLRDPLEAEAARAPRPALRRLIETTAQNEGDPRIGPYLDYLRACPVGVSSSIAFDFWRYIGNYPAEIPVSTATFHFFASCGKGDLSALGSGTFVPASRLSAPAREALERLVFRQPQVNFQVNRRTPQGHLIALVMGERCEPTFRIPGPLNDAVTLRLQLTTTDFAMGENFGRWSPLTPSAIASSIRTAQGRPDGPVYERFKAGVQYQLALEISIDGDTTFTHRTGLTDIDRTAPPIPYAKLPPNLRRQVEEELKE